MQRDFSESWFRAAPAHHGILSTSMVTIGKAQHGSRKSQKWSKRYQRDLEVYGRSVTSIPRGYEPLTKLRHRHHIIKLLQFIEARSKQRAGETKFYTQEMAKMIGKSVRTVYYYLEILRKFGYISVLTDNRHNRIKGKTNKFYSIRVIRCNRIIRARAAKIQPGRLFKVDIRPKTDASGYLPGTPFDWKQRDPSQYYDLIMAEDYDPQVDAIWRERREKMEYGDVEAFKFLGTTFKTDWKGYAIQ